MDKYRLAYIFTTALPGRKNYGVLS